MLVTKAAKRYATALFETAKESKQTDKVKKDVHFILDTLDDAKDLVRFLRNPVIKPADKQAVLKTLFSSHVSDLTQKFLDLVADKNRTDLLREIMHGFIDQYNSDAGIILIQARTAMPLSDSRQKDLRSSLEKATGKTVELSVEEQKSLKGGLLVQINDTIIDGTVKHKLEQLEQKLLDQTVQLN